MSLFDTHAHVLDAAFDADREDLLRSMPQEGLSGMIEIGVDVASSRRAAALAQAHDYIYAAAGVHPHEAAAAGPGYLDELRGLLERERVVAVGEIGLDYHYDYSPRDVQRRVFEEQLRLAGEMGLPVVIHMRKASEDTVRLLRRYPRVMGVMHCYSGSAETAEICLELGYSISFSGSVTFKNAVNLEAAARAVPTDRLMAETDCPYLTPEPYRGRRNDPLKVRHVLEKLAQIKGKTFGEMCDINRNNAAALFHL